MSTSVAIERVIRGSTSGTSNGFVIEESNSTKGEVLHKSFQPFFEAVNKSPLQVTKAVWGITPLLQLIGLFNKNIGKLARAFYGSCWAIVYSCYRPWAYERHSLPEKNKIPESRRNLFNINEHFRFGMGSLVSLIYGGGALGMLWSWFKGDDDLFDKAANIYQTGMFNQTQIFDSMNFTEILRRKYIPEQLKDFEKNAKNAKAKIEIVDSILFLPNIITRAMDTFRLFGAEFSENIQKIINVFAYTGYGTWAAKFGLLKQTEDKSVNHRGESILDPPNPLLGGNARKTDKALYNTQKYGARVFHTLLPGLSWLAAGTELFGFREIAENVFKLEGIFERLNPAIGSWCIRNTWLELFKKK